MQKPVQDVGHKLEIWSSLVAVSATLSGAALLGLRGVSTKDLYSAAKTVSGGRVTEVILRHEGQAGSTSDLKPIQPVARHSCQATMETSR